MNIPASVDIPARSSVPPIQPVSSSLMEKFLGMNLSTASLQSIDSDASDANDLDELDEQEIWGMEISGSPYGEEAKVQPQKPLPPRMASVSRRLSAIPESLSPRKDGSISRMSPTVNSLSSISGAHPGSSPLGNGGRNTAARILSNDAAGRRVPAASRIIPRVSQHGDPSSLAARPSSLPQSAPVNIPQWSKYESRFKNSRSNAPVDNDENEDSDDERLPPHEYLAREYARFEKTSSSVLEGAGRTLKGRDLSRVRNAVFTITGFEE
ncbi:hypothetical protein KP509_32G006200 [Ceratopteris richardii]|nr:hypothetical protein KP509_32G006200 [Ceratopteris richardii]